MRNRLRLIFALFAVILAASSARAIGSQSESGQRRALVVGIDDYANVGVPKGAAADARDISSVLRNSGVADLTVLIDSEVGRVRLLRELENLLARAQPGDRIFLSFAGNGGVNSMRSADASSGGGSVVFLLPGFDPQDPQGATEIISVAELKHFVEEFEKKGSSVILIVDAGSGDHLTREIDPRASPPSLRFVSYGGGVVQQSPAQAGDVRNEASTLKRSIVLFSADEQSKAPEIPLPGIGWRGALSYAVARALEDAGGLGHHGKIDAAEFIFYIRQLTYQLSDGRQIIRAAYPDKGKNELSNRHSSRGVGVRPLDPDVEEPRGSLEIILEDPMPSAPLASRSSSGGAVALLKTKEPIRIAALDGQSTQLRELRPHAKYEVVAPNAAPDLLWDPRAREVLSNGDIIAYGVDPNNLHLVIDKVAVMRQLKLRAVKALQAIKITPDDKLHTSGEHVDIAVTRLDGRSLILFNIAGDGTVQLLYPRESKATTTATPDYRFEEKVVQPYGLDQVVAVTTTQRQKQLEDSIRRLDQRREPGEILDLLERVDATDTRIGLAGLFTAP